MAKFYSKVSGGFYDSVVHGDNLPADAKVLTDEDYHALHAGQASGKVIGAATNGRPLLQSPPPHQPQPTPDLVAAIQAVVDGNLVAAQEALDRKV